DLKARGVEDILITVTDNLNGFTDTIKSVFPDSTTQICVVHQIRNSSRYVVWKEKKEFTSDLKNIYHAPAKTIGLYVALYWCAFIIMPNTFNTTILKY
ncbi:hypothetical protein EZS27_036302, partial [termite gut metagenome]